MLAFGVVGKLELSLHKDYAWGPLVVQVYAVTSRIFRTLVEDFVSVCNCLGYAIYRQLSSACWTAVTPLVRVARSRGVEGLGVEPGGRRHGGHWGSLPHQQR